MTDGAEPAIRILLVEDSDIDAELLAGHLGKADLDVAIERVQERRGFLAALGRGAFDVILADYSLPDFDGLSALTLARDARPDVPFIFVSGVVGEEFATNALKRGATDYIVKRNLSRLPAAIERALAEARERTERCRAEEALQALNVTLETQVAARTRERDRIWRLGRDLFAVIDQGGRLVAVNPAWWRVLGVEEAELLASSLHDLSHPDDAEGLVALLASVGSGHPVERVEGRLRQKDGGYRWIAWSGVPEGRVLYAVGRDITEAREAAAELERANDSLKAEIAERERVEATLRQLQRLEAIGQLTSGVAHDFNNLLTVVLGNVGFVRRALDRSGADAKALQRIENVRTAAERGAKLTAQLLAFSRRQRLEPKTVDLNDTVQGMRELLEGALGGAMRLEMRPAPGLWPALVDPTQIEMVILNLAINARDAMEVGGGLTVQTANVVLGEATLPEEPGPGEYVALIVSDTGAGMSQEVLAKAFEPFFTTKGPGRGSGLGLAQVYGFAKQSGGGVRIDTRAGQGTSVKVFLPRGVLERAEAADAVLDPARRAASPGSVILVVDDDGAVREVTSAILAELGYRVVQAAGGAAALEALGRERVDLMLADYAMPGMNGVETAAAARRLRPDLPVLFVTGYADFAALSELGEDLIVQKPFAEHELARKLRRMLAPADAGAPVG